MKYRVLWDKEALYDLKRIDKTTAKKIVEKVSSYLVLDPINIGKGLVGNLRVFMRYRFGDYRIIYQIIDSEITIVIVKI